MNEREFYARLVDRLAITARFSRATKVLSMEPPWSCCPAIGFFDVSYKDVKDIERFWESPEGRENLWEAMRLYREMPAQEQAKLDGIFAAFLEATIHALEAYGELKKRFKELAHDYKALLGEADWQVYETREYIRGLLLAIGHEIGPPAYKRLFEALNYQNALVRREVVLTFPPDQEASRFLAAVGHKLLTDPDVLVRRNAAYALELTKHPATAGYFMYALRHDINPRVRAWGAIGLASIGAPEHLLILEQVSKSDFAKIDLNHDWISKESETYCLQTSDGRYVPLLIPNWLQLKRVVGTFHVLLPCYRRVADHAYRAWIAIAERNKFLEDSWMITHQNFRPPPEFKAGEGLIDALSWGDRDGNIYECRLRQKVVAGQKFYIVEVKHWNVAARQDCIVEQSQSLADSEISRLQAQWHELCARYGCPDELCSQDLPQPLTLQ